MGSELSWGRDASDKRHRNVVGLTEENALSLVAAIVDGVNALRQNETLEHYKQNALLDAELKEAQRELARQVTEIASLRGHIDTLNGIIRATTPGAALMPQPPYVPAPIQAAPKSFPSSQWPVLTPPYENA